MAVCSAALLALPGAAAAQGATCGEVIVNDTILTEDLSNCAGDGLVVGAADVTIDLNGFTIDGTGAGAGVRSSHPDVVVRNGAVTQFGDGVSIAAAAVGTARLQALDISGSSRGIVLAAEPFQLSDPGRIGISRVAVHDNDTGVLARFWPHPSVIANSRVFANDRAGVEFRQSCCTTMRSTSISGNGVGVWLSFSGGNVLEHNRIIENADAGLIAERAGWTELTANAVSRNGGHGAVFTDTGADIAYNAFNRNAGDGLQLDETIAERRPLTVLTGNTANANGLFGIRAWQPGFGDGGGNVARRNGEPLQCSNFPCVS